jgi:hypothetical protein
MANVTLGSRVLRGATALPREDSRARHRRTILPVATSRGRCPSRRPAAMAVGRRLAQVSSHAMIWELNE